MSIQAVKAVELGTAVENAGKPGSEVHDEIFYEEDSFKRKSNRAGGSRAGSRTVKNCVRGYLNPLDLEKTLHSVDINTKAEDLAAFERSDITAVPAAGVIGEAMLAIVLANSMREKFGGDSIEEMRRNFDSYTRMVGEY